MDEAKRRWRDSGASRKEHQDRYRLNRENGERLRGGRRWPVRFGMVLAGGEGWQDHRDENLQRRKSACAWREANPRLRCLGTLVLHRLSQPATRLHQGVSGASRELGLCRRTVPEGGVKMAAVPVGAKGRFTLEVKPQH